MCHGSLIKATLVGNLELGQLERQVQDRFASPSSADAGCELKGCAPSADPYELQRKAFPGSALCECKSDLLGFGGRHEAAKKGISSRLALVEDTTLQKIQFPGSAWPGCQTDLAGLGGQHGLA